MVKLYDLRDDIVLLGNLRERALQGSGFRPEPYLIGTEDWWRAADAGAVER